MKLLELPVKPRRKIFAHLHNSDLLFMSFLSAKVRDEVRNDISQRPPYFVARTEAVLDGRILQFLFTGIGHTCAFIFDKHENQIPPGPGNSNFQVTIEGVVLKCRALWTRDYSAASVFVINEDQSNISPVIIIRYVEALAQQGVQNLVRTNVNVMDKMLTLEWTRPPCGLQITGDQMTVAQVEYLNKHWIDTACCLIEPPVVGKLKNNLKMIGVDNVQIANGGWVKRNHLLFFKGYTAHVENAKFTPADISEFVHKWKKGFLPKLEVLSVVFAKEHKFDFAKIVAEFHPWSYNPKRRSRYYVFKHRVPHEPKPPNRDLVDGLDLTREDGVVATFDYGKNALSHWFFFYIWHNPFPIARRQ